MKIGNYLSAKMLMIIFAMFLMADVTTAAETSFGERAEASADPIWIYDSDLDVKHVEVADLNGDGVLDVIAGEYSNTYYGDPSRVLAIDGATGDTLWTYLLQDGIRSMTIGDLTNDGVMDVIAGAAYNSSGTPDGYVHGINGLDGSQLWTYYVGATVSCVTVGYFNTDAHIDVAAGSFNDNVYAIDGRLGTNLWTTTISSLWINAVAAADVDGDGIDDVAYAHEYLAGWDNYFGVLNGTNGAAIWDSTVAYLNMDVMFEDIDGDDTLEVIFSGIYSDDHGEVFVRNALTGALEWSYNVGTVNHSNGDITLYSYDIDQDSDLDLVVATYLGERKIYAFNGDSNTPMWVSDTLDGNTRDVSFGDVTGDGIINIVTATSDRVRVLQGNNGARTWYYSVAGTIQSVACTDFDGNDTTDVAAGGGAEHSGSDPGKTVWALKTVPSVLLWEYSFGEYGNAIAIADFNDDGAEDVVSVCSLDDQATAISGANGGQLWQWTGTQNLYAVTTGDFNNDGIDDAAAAGADDIITALSGSDGSVMWQFTTPTDQIYRKCLKAADLNQDNYIDVIVGSNDNHIYAIRGEDGSELWSYDLGADANDVKLEDMNNNGMMDVVVAVGGGTYGEKVVVLKGADGTLLWEFAAPESVEHIAIGDVNDDGIMDVAAAVTPFTDVLIMIDGATRTQIWSQPVDMASNVQSIAAGDLDLDKIPEIIVPGSSTDKKVHAFSGIDGSELWSFETGGEVNCVLVYDVNNDGENEVVAGSDDQLVYVLSAADGSEIFSYSTADDVMDVQVGDINGNGLPNIACVTFGSDGVVYAFRSLASGPTYICGDTNGDELVNIFDITYLIDFLYREGPDPVDMNSADVNGDSLVNIFDITYLIDFLYRDGPEPNCL